MDGPALLAAILHAPADDAPRLVYADWLDEQAVDSRCPSCIGGQSIVTAFKDCPRCRGTGRPIWLAERAEFIRVQCELPRLNCETQPHRSRDLPVVDLRDAAVVCACPYCTFRRRESVLLTGDWRRLAPTFPLLMSRAVPPRLEGHAHVKFIRGFVESVTLPAADWLAHGDAILAAHPVTEVRLAMVLHSRHLEPGGPWRIVGDPTGRLISDAEYEAASGERIDERLLRCRWPAVKTWHLPPGPSEATHPRREAYYRTGRPQPAV